MITPDGFNDRGSNMAPQIENHLSPDGYNIYKTIIGGDTSYYCNAQILLSFNSTYGEQSLNIFDLNSDNIVTSADLLIMNSAYGQTAPHDWDLYQCEIFGQFSSGWFMDHPEWDAIFLKPTPQDELNNDYTPDELKSFVIEGSIDGVNHRVWYYKK
jgi:hypothetical protein